MFICSCAGEDWMLVFCSWYANNFFFVSFNFLGAWDNLSLVPFPWFKIIRICFSRKIKLFYATHSDFTCKQVDAAFDKRGGLGEEVFQSHLLAWKLQGLACLLTQLLPWHGYILEQIGNIMRNWLPCGISSWK